MAPPQVNNRVITKQEKNGGDHLLKWRRMKSSKREIASYAKKWGAWDSKYPLQQKLSQKPDGGKEIQGTRITLNLDNQIQKSFWDGRLEGTNMKRKNVKKGRGFTGLPPIKKRGKEINKVQ